MDTKYKPGFALDFGMGMITSALPGFILIIPQLIIQYYNMPKGTIYIVAIIVYGTVLYLMGRNSEKGSLGWSYYLAYILSACIMLANISSVNCKIN